MPRHEVAGRPTPSARAGGGPNAPTGPADSIQTSHQVARAATARTVVALRTGCALPGTFVLRMPVFVIDIRFVADIFEKTREKKEKFSLDEFAF